MLSVVIPLYNESESIESLYRKLIDIVPLLDKRYEIIFVDDGSTDRSLEKLKEIVATDSAARLFSFRKNQGKAEALMLGFAKAKGDYIVTLDADLQDKPEEIVKLLDKAKQGWDVVCGWRKNRQDPFFKVVSSKLFNFLASILWRLHLHDYNCGLKVYTKDAAKALRIYGGLHRFIPLILHQLGFKVTEVPIVHEKRKFGKSKFGFSKLWKDLPDIFTMLFLSRYRERPLHFFGMVGGTVLVVGLVILTYLSLLRFQGQTIGGRPLLLFGVLLVLSGFQIVFTGFLADLLISVSNSEKKDFLLKYSSDTK